MHGKKTQQELTFRVSVAKKFKLRHYQRVIKVILVSKFASDLNWINGYNRYDNNPRYRIFV